jgi:WD40 repeat protein
VSGTRHGAEARHPGVAMEPGHSKWSAWRRRSLLVVSVGALGLVAPGVAGATPAAPGGPGSANTWVPTGPMAVARQGQTATLLGTGDVLIAGGQSATAELYDPATGTFARTGSTSGPREDATATLLADGDVLLAGGSRGSAQLSTVELYDPGTGTWTPTGSMPVARSGQTATLLADGDVLVAGGGCNGQAYGCDSGSFEAPLKSADLYDPTSGTWSATGSMAEGRQFATATLLADGDVLAAGGFAECDDDFCSDLRTAELYDPATGRWDSTGSFPGPRQQGTATLLSDGDVLLAGGLNVAGPGDGSPLDDADLYDAATGVWTPTAPMPAAHFGQTATLLPNGWVLVAGGQSAAAAVFEPPRAIWVATGSMSTPRTDATATLLPDSRVLVTGGSGTDGAAQATAELYVVGRGPLVSLASGPLGFGAQQVGTTGGAQSVTLTNDGTAKLAISGVTISGADPSDFTARSGCPATLAQGGSCTVSVRFAPTAVSLRTAEVGVVDDAPLSPQAIAVSGYGAGPNTFAPTGSMVAARSRFSATLLGDGDVLVAGGEDGFETYLSGAELYDPATGTFTPTGSLVQARAFAPAVLLSSGDVLVAGGVGTGPAVLSSAELYDPTTGNWSLTQPMNESGDNLSAVLLPDGDVLVEGFVSGAGAEVFDPTSGAWTDTGALGGPGYFDTATLLPDGDVLAAGGDTTDAAVYDPATNDWTSTGDMAAAQLGSTATLLPDGDVLFAGGINGDDEPLATSQLYDPSAGTWSLTSSPMPAPRDGQTATLLSGGEVMVTGGCISECDNHDITASTAVFDPSAGVWYAGPPMVQSRVDQSATELADGDLLVAGGGDYCCQTYDTAELYTPTLLSADPTSGPVGQQVTLEGSGYFAHETVKVTWDGGTAALARVATSAQGTFTVDITVPQTGVGAHTIDAEGLKSDAYGLAAFRVTASS